MSLLNLCYTHIFPEQNLNETVSRSKKMAPAGKAALAGGTGILHPKADPAMAHSATAKENNRDCEPLPREPVAAGGEALDGRQRIVDQHREHADDQAALQDEGKIVG